jgi:heat shock protein HslJ
MKNRKLLPFALVIVALVLALAACAPAPTSQVIVAPTFTATPVPPTTTLVSPTATPEPPTSTPTQQVTLDVKALENLEYRSEWMASGTAPLTDGEYSEAAAPGSATKTVVKMYRVAFGDAPDGRPFAAVILVTDPGGSGTFYDLAAVAVQDGKLAHVASVFLGDRVKIESLVVEDGEVVVEMVKQGPHDPMCCPTQRVVERYALQNELVQVSSEIQSDTSDTSDLVGIVWEWERFLGNDGSVLEVNDPSRYTLVLNPDGTYQVGADCNMSGGAYTLDGGSLTLQPGPTTLAECEPGSLYDEFLAYLGHVRTHVRADDGKLVLDLWADAGQMVFRPVQAIQLPEAEPDLVGITWEWVAFLGGDDSRIDVDDPSLYTLTLNPDGTYQVKADCNMAGGAYTLDEAHLALEPGPMTLAECGPDSLYDEFLTKLGYVRTYVYVADEGEWVLDLWADAGQMVFQRAEPPGTAVSLEDTLWQLASYGDGQGNLVDVLLDAEVTAEFSDGQIAGSAGCNRYSASYSLEGSAIALGPVAVTRMICAAPDGIMEQEHGYLVALGSATAYRIDGDSLELTDVNGVVLATFVAATN